MKVVNLYGGPGTGKSTTAAALFAELKYQGVRAELVTEYAKELTYEKSPLLKNQHHILNEQRRRLRILEGQVDVAITDSPLLLSLIYCENPLIQQCARSSFDAFDNLNVFLERVKPYQHYGRSQTEDEARHLDKRILDLPITFDLTVKADRCAARLLLPHVLEFLQ